MLVCASTDPIDVGHASDALSSCLPTRKSVCVCLASRILTDNASKKKVVKLKRKSPSTQAEGDNRPRTRSRVAVGTATSPGGSKHTYMANSGITPDGCDDAGKAVLRMSMKHTGVPGHSATSPAGVSDSPVRGNVSPVKMAK